MGILLLSLFLGAPPAKPTDQRVPRLETIDQIGRRDQQAVPLPPDALRRCGSGLFRIGAGEHDGPAFSPSGETVYVTSMHDVLAFDSKTGLQRFAYRYGGQNLSASIEDSKGIRIEFHEGHLTGKYVVLEHDTGKELERGSQLKGTLRTASSSARELKGGRRALVWVPLLQNPRLGPRSDHSIVLWDLFHNRKLMDLGEYDGLHECLAVSHNHKRIAFAPGGSSLKVFDSEKGKVLHEVPLNLDGLDWQGYLPVWSRDDTKLYAWRRIDQERQIIEIDAVSGELRVVLKDRPFASGAPVISPDLKHFAYLHEDVLYREVPIWNVIKLDDLTLYRSIDVRPARPSVEFSPDSRSLWLLGECGLVRYDLATGEFATMRCDPLSSVTALAFSRDSARLYGVAGAELITWDVTSGQECAPRQKFDDFARRLSGVRCVSVDATGENSVWVGGDSQVRHVERGQEKAKFYAANGRPGEDYIISPDGMRIVHDAYHGELVLGDFRTGKKLFELYPAVRPRNNYVLSIAPNSRTLAVIRRDHQKTSEVIPTHVELWDLQRLEKTGEFMLDAADMWIQMEFSSDSKELSAWHRGTVSVWDVAMKKPVSQRKATNSIPNSLRTADGRHYFQEGYNSETRERVLQMKNVADNKIVRSWQCFNFRTTAMSLSPDESFIAVATPEGPVALVDLRKSGREK